MEVPKAVIEKIRSLATKPFDVGEKYDKKIVELLLIVCVGTTVVSADKINKDVRDFVHGNIHYNITTCIHILVCFIVSITRTCALQCFLFCLYLAAILAVRIQTNVDERFVKVESYFAAFVEKFRK